MFLKLLELRESSFFAALCTSFPSRNADGLLRFSWYNCCLFLNKGAIRNHLLLKLLSFCYKSICLLLTLLKVAVLKKTLREGGLLVFNLRAK